MAIRKNTGAAQKQKKTTAASFTQRGNQGAEKLRNLAENELLARQAEMADQLFRLRFQLKMGQTESVKKLRELRKDIARAKTILRGRQLGVEASATTK